MVLLTLLNIRRAPIPSIPNSFFNVQIVSLISGPGITISWSAAPGKTYRPQFKNSLTDPAWLDLNGTVGLIGAKGYAGRLITGRQPTVLSSGAVRLR